MRFMYSNFFIYYLWRFARLFQRSKDLHGRDAYDCRGFVDSEEVVGLTGVVFQEDGYGQEHDYISWAAHDI